MEGYKKSEKTGNNDEKLPFGFAVLL